MTKSFETIKNPWDNTFDFRDGKIFCRGDSEILLIYRTKQKLKNTLLQIDKTSNELELNVSSLTNYLSLTYKLDKLENFKRFIDLVIPEIDYIKTVLAKPNIDYGQIAKDLIFSLNMKIENFSSNK